ncbi:MAG TPA: sulfurtransferase, partial [Gammaproteobacteria bacterium]|nr:sulfurtransferase [Gammaproteobacteria bacterium]
MNRLITLLLVPLAFSAIAADVPEKASMRTKAGLYVDARESHDMLTKPEGREVVLVDVRDAVEIKFTGYTDMTAIHVPWKIIDASRWDEKKQSYGGSVNKNFGEDVTARLDALGVSKDAH